MIHRHAELTPAQLRMIIDQQRVRAALVAQGIPHPADPSVESSSPPSLDKELDQLKKVAHDAGKRTFSEGERGSMQLLVPNTPQHWP